DVGGVRTRGRSGTTHQRGIPTQLWPTRLCDVQLCQRRLYRLGGQAVSDRAARPVRRRCLWVSELGSQLVDVHLGVAHSVVVAADRKTTEAQGARSRWQRSVGWTRDVGRA